MKKKEPMITPIPKGNKNGKYKLEIEARYASYTPINIKIKVLLTPGIMIPADIKKPAIIKNKKLKLEADELWVIVFSKNTHKRPVRSEIKRYIKNVALNFCLEQAFFKSEGIQPNY